MPWKETQVFEERLKFVTAYLEGNWSVSELCHAFGVSRKPAYKYIERYAELEPISDQHWTLHWGPVELGIVDNAKNALIQHENFSFTRRRADWDEEG